MRAVEEMPVLLNRELSALKFNERVLSMAERADVPALERLRYLCIVGSNLDEFFEIRMASLKEQQRQTPELRGVDGMTPDEAFDRVQRAAHALVDRQNRLLTGEVMPRLMEHGVGLIYSTGWNDLQREWAHGIFRRDVIPLLTPIGLDPAHPFPRVYNKSLNFIIALSGEDAFGREGHIAIVQAPRALPRMIKVPAEIAGIPDGFMLLTTLINAFVGELFPGMNVQGCYQWRVTRNSDLFVDEEEITNLRQALQGELSQRNFGASVRLEIAHAMPPDLELFLQREFSLGAADTYRVNGPVNLTRLMQLCNRVNRPDLEYPPFRPRMPAPFDGGLERPDELFAAIAARDHLLHHPYQSFQPVLMFLRSAALDPQVVAIKQTIYRTGEDSELMGLLLSAARAGKEVTVVVELMARFDEQTNINWAARLEEVGAHVSYGVVGHKTHAKMLLVVRREADGLRRYVHLGTGNYNPSTARHYEDFGLMTCDED
ncbi:MAG: polyphosphate kinase 1, partial [Castellaniella sp.]